MVNKDSHQRDLFFVFCSFFFSFEIKNLYWSKVVTRKPRDLSLVVLEKEVKTMILEDLTWFLKEDAFDFYSRYYSFFCTQGERRSI